jgi:hypothetical protein
MPASGYYFSIRSELLREASPNISKERDEFLTAASMNMAVFWDVAPCSLVGTDRRFKGAYCLLRQSNDQYLPDYTAQHPRRQPSSY